MSFFIFAADFALTLKLGELHSRLPLAVPFTIVSGDRGFEELATGGHLGTRGLTRLNPHKLDFDELFVLLRSVTDV